MLCKQETLLDTLEHKELKYCNMTGCFMLPCLNSIWLPIVKEVLDQVWTFSLAFVMTITKDPQMPPTCDSGRMRAQLTLFTGELPLWWCIATISITVTFISVLAFIPATSSSPGGLHLTFSSGPNTYMLSLVLFPSMVTYPLRILIPTYCHFILLFTDYI